MTENDVTKQLNDVTSKILAQADSVGLDVGSEKNASMIFDLLMKVKDLESNLKLESVERERDFFKSQCEKFARESDSFREKYNNSYRENQAKEERLLIQAREASRSLRNDCIKELFGLAGAYFRTKK